LPTLPVSEELSFHEVKLRYIFGFGHKTVVRLDTLKLSKGWQAKEFPELDDYSFAVN